MAKAIENQIEKGLLCRGRETEKGMGVERGCCRQRRLQDEDRCITGRW